MHFWSICSHWPWWSTQVNTPKWVGLHSSWTSSQIELATWKWRNTAAQLKPDTEHPCFKCLSELFKDTRNPKPENLVLAPWLMLLMQKGSFTLLWRYWNSYIWKSKNHWNTKMGFSRTLSCQVYQGRERSPRLAGPKPVSPNKVLKSQAWHNSNLAKQECAAVA